MGILKIGGACLLGLGISFGASAMNSQGQGSAMNFNGVQGAEDCNYNMNQQSVPKPVYVPKDHRVIHSCTDKGGTRTVRTENYHTKDTEVTTVEAHADNITRGCTDEEHWEAPVEKGCQGYDTCKK